MQACFSLCDAHPNCKQAIWEDEFSPWGVQCWLGSNDMTELPGPSRDCSTAIGNKAGHSGRCSDYCYAKNGFPGA